MFVRVTHMTIAPENWDEALRRFQTEVVSALERRSGFLRTILTGDASAGKAMAITMWQSAEHERGEQPAQQDPVAIHMTGLIVGDPQTSGYPELFERAF